MAVEPRAGLSGRHVAAPLAVADQGQLCLCRRPDAGVRRRRASVLRRICFNRAKPTNGSIYVARYNDDGASYRFTTLVERGTPSVAGLFQDKINITADQNNGNVYVAWARFSGNLGNDVIMFKRSTDGGRTYSKPTRISDGGASEQFADLAVGPDGAVYLDVAAPRGVTGARLDRDRQVDERGRVVDAPADRRDHHRL